jgi:signal transduction histidine kinase/CheY-like chemotaxis protein
MAYRQKLLGVLDAPFQPGVFNLGDDVIWRVNTKGLVRIKTRRNYFINYLNTIPNPPSTRGILKFKDDLYVNSYSGLFRIRLADGTSRLYPDKHNFLNTSLAITSRDGLLLLGLLNDQVGTIHPITEQKDSLPVLGVKEGIFAFAFETLPDGSIWMASEKGAWRMAPGTNFFAETPLKSSLRCMYRNQQGLWFGGVGGLTLLDSSGQIKTFLEQDVSNVTDIFRIEGIHEDKDGIFWLATSKGLWRWRPFSNEVKIFDPKNNKFPNNFLHAVYEDGQERLWLPSDFGLIVFDKKTAAIRSFFKRDGLPVDEFNVTSHYRDENGVLYMGGIGGITSFHPDSIVWQTSCNCRPALNQFILFDLEDGKLQNITREAIGNTQAIVIHRDIDRIQLSFSVPSFAGEIMEYRWRYANRQDTLWRVIERPEIELFEMPYGTYALEIQATRKGSGFSSSNTLIIPLKVVKPFHLTWSFYAVLTAFITLLIWLWSLWRERYLKRLNLKLRAEVAEKTEHIQRERDIIAHQAELLRQLNAEKINFFQDVSHELRTPLTLILGPAKDMLQQGDLSERHVSRVERIRRNAQKMWTLVEEILELTNLDAGRIALEETPVPLVQFIRRVAGEFSSLATQHDIDFVVNVKLPEDCVVWLDAQKAEKILNNLISNAFKFTQAGGTVQVLARWQPMQILEVVVQDSGIGIPEDYIEKIFERHFRVPQQQSGYTKGFGIGLATARSYARLMNGSLFAESAVGQWTRLVFQLPLRYADTAELTPPETFGASSEILKRIVLIEDIPELSQHIQQLLAGKYQLEVFDNGVNALEYLQGGAKADLILSDLVVPGLDGLSLLVMIRADAQLCSIPFILMSAQMDDAHRMEAIRLGADACLSKPIDEQELMARVRRLLLK